MGRVGWINNSHTQYIDENYFMIKVYFSIFQGMRNLKAGRVGWINNSHTQYIDENYFMIKVYFSNEVSYKNTNCY